MNSTQTDGKEPQPDLKKVVVFVGILGFAQFVVFLSAFELSSFYPEAALARGLTGVQTGWILGILHFVALFVVYLEFQLIQVVSLKKQLILGLVSSGICCILFGFSYSIENKTLFIASQFVCRLFHGISLATTDISSFILTNIKTPIAYLSTAMGVLEGLLSFSLLVAAPMGSFLFQAGGYFAPFLVAGGLCLLYAIVICIFIDETDCDKNLTTAYALKKSFNWGMSYYIYAFLLYGALLGFFATMLAPKVLEFGLNLSQVGLVMMISNAVQALVFPIWGQICDRSEKYSLVTFVSYFIVIFGMIFFGPFPGLVEQLWNFKIFTLSVVICATGMSGISVAAFLMCKIHLVKTCGNDDIAGTLVSVTYIGFCNCGVTVGDFIGGLLIDYIGYSYGSLIWCGLVVIGIIFQYLIFRFDDGTHKNDDVKDPQPVLKEIKTIITN